MVNFTLKPDRRYFKRLPELLQGHRMLLLPPLEAVLTDPLAPDTRCYRWTERLKSPFIVWPFSKPSFSFFFRPLHPLFSRPKWFRLLTVGASALEETHRKGKIRYSNGAYMNNKSCRIEFLIVDHSCNSPNQVHWPPPFTNAPLLFLCELPQKHPCGWLLVYCVTFAPISHPANQSFIPTILTHPTDHSHH